jgi:hypothetical protein
MVEISGLTTRSASMISGIYINNQLSGGLDIGFKYQVCQNAEYRIRVIKIDCICVGGDNIIATTANGPEWTKFPANSGQLCLRLNDADIIQGQRVRFEISIRNNGKCDFVIDDFSLGEISAAPLPVTFLGVVAKKENNAIKVSWDVAEEINVKGYQVERSEDGTNYTVAGFVNAQSKPAYSFLDNQVGEGTFYYRIRNLDFDNQSKTSNVVKVINNKKASTIKIFPVPAQKQVTLQHDKANAQTQITLATIDGRALKQITLVPGAYQTTIDLSGLIAGIYMIRWNDGNGQTETLKLIKQ